VLRQDLESLVTVARRQRLEAGLLQLELSDAAEILLVVDDQNPLTNHARSPRERGKNRLKVVPWSWFLVTVTVPPCCVTI